MKMFLMNIGFVLWGVAIANSPNDRFFVLNSIIALILAWIVSARFSKKTSGD